MHNLSRRRAFQLLPLLAATLLVTSPASVGAETVPLAIKGYDPVAYFTLGRPVGGLAEIEYAWDEHRYRFSTAEHRELFKADPARYAPQFQNFCAMALSTGELVVADPENWLISEGKLLYLWQTSPSRTRSLPKRSHRQRHEGE
jgi:hypothetical protein